MSQERRRMSNPIGSQSEVPPQLPSKPKKSSSSQNGASESGQAPSRKVPMIAPKNILPKHSQLSIVKRAFSALDEGTPYYRAMYQEKRIVETMEKYILAKQEASEAWDVYMKDESNLATRDLYRRVCELDRLWVQQYNKHRSEAGEMRKLFKLFVLGEQNLIQLQKTATAAAAKVGKIQKQMDDALAKGKSSKGNLDLRKLEQIQRDLEKAVEADQKLQAQYQQQTKNNQIFKYNKIRKAMLSLAEAETALYQDCWRISEVKAELVKIHMGGAFSKITAESLANSNSQSRKAMNDLYKKLEMTPPSESEQDRPMQPERPRTRNTPGRAGIADSDMDTDANYNPIPDIDACYTPIPEAEADYNPIPEAEANYIPIPEAEANYNSNPEEYAYADYDSGSGSEDGDTIYEFDDQDFDADDDIYENYDVHKEASNRGNKNKDTGQPYMDMGQPYLDLIDDTDGNDKKAHSSPALPPPRTTSLPQQWQQQRQQPQQKPQPQQRQQPQPKPQPQQRQQQQQYKNPHSSSVRQEPEEELTYEDTDAVAPIFPEPKHPPPVLSGGSFLEAQNDEDIFGSIGSLGLPQRSSQTLPKNLPSNQTSSIYPSLSRLSTEDPDSQESYGRVWESQSGFAGSSTSSSRSNSLSSRSDSVNSGPGSRSDSLGSAPGRGGSTGSNHSGVSDSDQPRYVQGPGQRGQPARPPERTKPKQSLEGEFREKLKMFEQQRRHTSSSDVQKSEDKPPPLPVKRMRSVPGGP